MALPLFRLPILVIKLLLETMGFIDLFVLTSASTKTKRLVQNLVTIRKHKLRIFMEKKDIHFNFQPDHDSCSDEQIYSELGKPRSNDPFSLKIGSIDHVASEFSEATEGPPVLLTYWSTNKNHGAELYNALIEIFKMPLAGIKMELDGVDIETYRRWINWNNEYSFDASCLAIEGASSFQEYIWILKNVRTKHKLFLKVEPSDYPENFEVLNVEIPSIIIQHGRWVKLQQLKAFKAERITVDSASLTDAEINTFIRYWMDSEEASMLKQLTIRFNREANSEVVLEGMDATDEDLMKPDDALNQWNFKMASGERCTVIYAEYDENVQTFGFEFIVGK